MKSGAFFPTISLENDDLGWASPYTLTPSAINSWIGDELRSIGSEATMRWKKRLWHPVADRRDHLLQRPERHLDGGARLGAWRPADGPVRTGAPADTSLSA